MTEGREIVNASAYRDVVQRLTALDDQAAEYREEAQRWYDDLVAAAAAKVEAAEQDVREAQRALAEARRAQEAMDARAAGVWTDYVHRVGPSAERYGRTKPPPTVPLQRDRTAEDYLQQAIASASATPAARAPTGGVKTVFVLIGVAGGAVGGGIYELVRWSGRAAGGDYATAAPVLALIVMLLGPVLAVVAAKLLTDRRGVTLDVAEVATVMVTGIVTAGLALAALRGWAGH